MNIFVSGGCKNGKSYYAQRLAKQMAEEQNLPLYYVATMLPKDEEDHARIRRHLKEREGWGFITLEQPLDILGCLGEESLTEKNAVAGSKVVAAEKNAAAGSNAVAGSKVVAAEKNAAAESNAVAGSKVVAAGKNAGNRETSPIVNRRCGVFLLDSVTALLSNEMFRAGGEMDLNSSARVAKELEQFAKLTGNTVFVSDYIYSDSRCFDEYTECYREGLALCDKTLAKACDRVFEVTYGIPKEWK